MTYYRDNARGLARMFACLEETGSSLACLNNFSQEDVTSKVASIIRQVVKESTRAVLRREIRSVAERWSRRSSFENGKMYSFAVSLALGTSFFLTPVIQCLSRNACEGHPFSVLTKKRPISIKKA